MSSHDNTKKLGWLSSYSRQILLARYFLREIPRSLSEGELLALFRLSITVLAGGATDRVKIFAPYFPSDRPYLYTLKLKDSSSFRKGSAHPIVLSMVVGGTNLPVLEFDFGFKSHSSKNYKASEVNFSLLAHELKSVGKGVNLFNKALGDQRCDELRKRPLWQGIRSQNQEDFLGSLRARKHFQFWHEWYAGLHDGSPMDWELQKRISQISSKLWEAGAQRVAEEIEVIRADYLSERLPLAEVIELNESSGKLRAVPVLVANGALVSATLSRVADALSDATENPSNGINERSIVARILSRTLARYGNDPQRIEMDFTAAHTSLISLIATDEIPASDEVAALQRALLEGAQAIRATHPDVAENRRILANQALRELTDEQRSVLEDALPMLVDISEAALQSDFVEDVSSLIKKDARRGGAPRLGIPERNAVLANYGEGVRTFGRVSPIFLLFRKYPEILASIEENSIYRSATIISTLAGLIALGVALL